MIDRDKITDANILAEQFIPDHVFLYVTMGTVHCYDGNKNYTFKAGEYCIVRKNRLARYKIENGKNEFDCVLFCFDEQFLKSCQNKNKRIITKFKSPDTFVKIKPVDLVPNFIRSLKPYSNSSGKLDAAFEDVKYEELLIILLQKQPEPFL